MRAAWIGTVDGRLLGFLVAAGAVVVMAIARRRLRARAQSGALADADIPEIRRRMLALLFTCGLAVAAAMTAAVVASNRSGDDLETALASGGVIAGIVVAGGAVRNAIVLWRGGGL